MLSSCVLSPRRAAVWPVTNRRHDQTAYDGGGEHLDGDARDPLEFRSDQRGHHVGRHVRAGAAAVTDRAGDREHQQHHRKIERAVERGVEDVAADDVDDDRRHQGGEHRAAAIERDRVHHAVDGTQQRVSRRYAHLFIAR